MLRSQRCRQGRRRLTLRLVMPLLLFGVGLSLQSAFVQAQRNAGGMQALQTGGKAEQAERGPAHVMPAFIEPDGMDVVLGRVTAQGITVSVLSHDRDRKVRIEWQPQAAGAEPASQQQLLQRGQPAEISVQGLRADTAYRYTVQSLDDTQRLTGSFHTQRAPGQSFVFTVTADSHLDQNTSPRWYAQTLANVVQDAPDFHVDLGDTFMTEKHADRESASRQYLAQRSYLSRMALQVPLYLVLGNHDGESLRQLSETGRGGNKRSSTQPSTPAANQIDNQTSGLWANAQRRFYFPNPVPDGFYTGNGRNNAAGAAPQDYYAWQWGDALLVVLNPYSYAAASRNDDRWGLSLGDAQYQWLHDTLQNSRARYKFLFIHQLAGGLDEQGRGGSEAVPYGEWGGRNADGSEGFKTHRPGWAEPIHALLKRTGVTAVFHGHDHLFAAQAVDGIVYQEVPQPGHAGLGNLRQAAEYGYRSGTVLMQSGHLRIRVQPQAVQVELVGVNPDQPTANRSVLHTYTIQPRNQD